MARLAVLTLLPGLAFGGVNIPTRLIAPGVEMPVMSIGTWTSLSKKADFNVSNIVGSWLELGGIGIDTALMYFTQADIARVIADRGVDRRKLFITSKIPGCMGKPLAKFFVDQDLKRLNTSYIDLMLVHWPGLGCKGTWEALEEYQEQGKLRAIGVSNFNAGQLASLLKEGRVPPAVNQIEYNVYSHPDDTVAFCKAHNITVEAWSPLGDPARTHSSVFTDPAVVSVAQAHNVSAAQVALRWIVQKGHTLTFLSSSKTHQASDADLFSFSLAADEVSKLDALQKKGSNEAVYV